MDPKSIYATYGKHKFLKKIQIMNFWQEQAMYREQAVK